MNFTIITYKITNYLFSIAYNVYKLVSYKLNITYPNVKKHQTRIIKGLIYSDFNILIDDNYYLLTFINIHNIDISEINYNSIIEYKQKYIHNVLNCTISVDDKIIDITKEIQKLYHLFFTNSYFIIWDNVLEFALENINSKLKHNILENGWIQITLSDDEMTLYYYKIDDILNKKFYLHEDDTYKKMF